MDLQELTSALTQVEADAAASAGEKLRLRREYESKIEAVVRQMEGLQEQMRQQVGRVLGFQPEHCVGCWGFFHCSGCMMASLVAEC